MVMKSTWSANSGCVIQTCQGSAVDTGTRVAARTFFKYEIKPAGVRFFFRMVSLPTTSRVTCLCVLAAASAADISRSLLVLSPLSQAPSVSDKPCAPASAGSCGHWAAL